MNQKKVDRSFVEKMSQSTETIDLNVNANTEPVKLLLNLIFTYTEGKDYSLTGHYAKVATLFDFKKRVQEERMPRFTDHIEYHAPLDVIALQVLSLFIIRWQKRKADTEETRASLEARLRMTLYWMWYTFLTLKVEGDRTEFDHFSELIEACRCPADLDDISILVSVYAGHEAEDRDKFLATLRRVFASRLEAIKGIRCMNCDCGRNLKNVRSDLLIS